MRFGLILLGICLAAFVAVWGSRSAEPARTGPDTEKRFPRLQVPPGFQATLFACDPLIEYPSVIAIGPWPGALFVAIDYMTGLGTEIVRRDEVRLVEDTDGDGYADRATVFAEGFNSIQGIAYHAGTLYVMHAPYLTALRDSKGTGKADERRDLLTGLGLTPEANPVRLHCANGVVVGHDGWLYLAVGDHGADVRRPEGDHLVHRGGGILRCRPDGTDLHVFASGLRNVYDVALDAEANVLLRDNENDGGTYKIRICHSFHGADHGYPYLYEERADEALAPLADLGLGSSAGAVCYLERQFPPEYRGNLLFCEWGRSVVRCQPQQRGSSFAPLQEQTFAEGASGDPYGFKPTDLVVQGDGTLMVSDWADGQRPKRGRGRIYRITHGDGPAKGTIPPGGKTAGLAQLDSESYYERWDAQEALGREGGAGRKRVLDALAGKSLGVRGRMHAVWALARLERLTAIDDLMRVAERDPSDAVRAQAVRAVGDLADPDLVRRRLNSGTGDADLAVRLSALGQTRDDRLRREVLIVLGRLRWPGVTLWLKNYLGQPDAALAHAAQQALRRSGDWQGVLIMLDEPEGDLRTVALRAAAERFEPVIIDGLIFRLGRETSAGRRRQYADALTRVCKKPGAPVYWGYRPGPRAANSVAWEKTAAIVQALDRVLADPDRALRRFVLERLRREQIPVPAASLARWLEAERQPENVAVLVAALAEQPSVEARRALRGVIRDRRQTSGNRLAALAAFGPNDAPVLRTLVEELEDGPVLADAIRRASKEPVLRAILKRKLVSPDAEVRAAVIEAFAELGAEEGRDALPALLADSDVRVRRAAAAAAGKLKVREALDTLLVLATDADIPLRRASLASLSLLREPRGIPAALNALTERSLELDALRYLQDLGGPEQAQAIVDFARHTPSAEAPAAAIRALTAWRGRQGGARQALDRAVAEVQGATGVPIRWEVLGPLTAARAAPIVAELAKPGQVCEEGATTRFAAGLEGRLVLGAKEVAKEAYWIASAELFAPVRTPVEFRASSKGGLEVWLNGRSLHRRDKARSFQIDSDRFPGVLEEGVNRLLVQVHSFGSGEEFHVRFRRKSASADHERLAEAALTRPGDAERGRKLFLDTEKSLCLKCHRLGEQGERIGPELTGVGTRFSRIYVVESILEPSRTIAPSYGAWVMALKNGTVLTGVKVAETPTTVTLADNQARKLVLLKADIEEQQTSPQSVMPEGLEKRFTEAEFIDLIAFLMSEKQIRSR